MKYLRWVRRLLDPWAALLLGVLVTLGVVILLATPGPWHRVMGPPPAAKLAPAAPNDIAVFVRGGGERCSAVVWLHAAYERPSLTAVVVASSTQGISGDGGLARVSRLVDDAGAEDAAAALGNALGVEMDAWAVISANALRVAVPTMFPVDEERAQLRAFRRARSAWAGRRGVHHAWRRQYETLRQALPRVPLDQLTVVGFANYVLGFGFVESDLDLQRATALARMIRDLKPYQVRVRAAPAIVEVCRGATAWRVDGSVLDALHRSLALELVPAASKPTVKRRAVRQQVLVLGAPATAAPRHAYMAELRRQLRRSAGTAVEVTALRSDAADPSATLAARLDSGRVLAVVVASPATGATSAAAGSVELGEVAAVLRTRAQPAIVAASRAGNGEAAGDSEAAEAADAVGLPVSQVTIPAEVGGEAGSSLSPGAAVRLARGHAATLVRACWPGVLAPRLASTRLGFSFAARRAVSAAVFGGGVERNAAVAARMITYGYQGSTANGEGWQPRLPVDAVYYRAENRRGAVALAGDLGIDGAAVLRDDDAPETLTVWLES